MAPLVSPLEALSNTAIRYYEDALDNYQYTNGNLIITSIDSNGGIISEADPELNQWEKRLFFGDKIRIADEDGVLSPWLRVTNKGTSNDATTLTVVGNLDNFTVSSNALEYIATRAYTPGYAEIDLTEKPIINAFDPNDDLRSFVGPSTEPAFSNIVRIVVPNEQLQTGVTNSMGNIIQVGDSLSFSTVASLLRSPASAHPVVGATDATIQITLVNGLSHHTIWHYHSRPRYADDVEVTALGFTSWAENLGDTPNPEMEDRIGDFDPFDSPTSGVYRTLQGSYAIYPAKSNGEVSRFYQTWNVHNYVTTNADGQGVHGDLTSGILNNFAESDEDGQRHKVVVVANDSGYVNDIIGDDDVTTYYRDRDLNLLSETQVVSGIEEYYISQRDRILYQSFLSAGGRLITGGQHNFISEGDLYDRLGILETVSFESGPTEIIREVNDPITNAYNSGASLNVGAEEGSQLTVDGEALNTNTTPAGLVLSDGTPFARMKRSHFPRWQFPSLATLTLMTLTPTWPQIILRHSVYPVERITISLQPFIQASILLRWRFPVSKASIATPQTQTPQKLDVIYFSRKASTGFATPHSRRHQLARASPTQLRTLKDRTNKSLLKMVIPSAIHFT